MRSRAYSAAMPNLREATKLPLLLAARACSFREIAEYDALRSIGLNSSHRTIAAQVRTRREYDSALLYAFLNPAVRTVFYHRLNCGTRKDKLMRLALRLFYPGQPGVEIKCDSRDIGPGFVLGHGQACVIWAKRIGRDSTIFQQVTLGLRDGKSDSAPILGDRVWIWPGAIVIGRNIGDDATVGAGAVVVREDVPAGATVVGVPAGIIDR
jgi:serine acetyltransferase